MKTIQVAVVGSNKNNAADLAVVTVHCTEDDYALGKHYGVAVERANDRIEKVQFTFDENEPAWKSLQAPVPSKAVEVLLVQTTSDDETELHEDVVFVNGVVVYNGWRNQADLYEEPLVFGWRLAKTLGTELKIASVELWAGAETEEVYAAAKIRPAWEADINEVLKQSQVKVMTDTEATDKWVWQWLEETSEVLFDSPLAAVMAAWDKLLAFASMSQHKSLYELGQMPYLEQRQAVLSTLGR